MLKKVIFYTFLLFFTCTGYALTEDNYDSPKKIIPVYKVTSSISLISNKKITWPARNVEIKTTFPVLESTADNEAIDDFNQIIKAFLAKETSAFKDNVKALKAENPKGAKLFGASLDIDYNSSIVKAKQDTIVSIRFNIEGNIGPMAHPYHNHRVINYNLTKGSEIELANLFRPDSNYLNVIAQYCRDYLIRHLKAGDWKEQIISGTAPTLENYKNWNIKDEGLFITFDEYQVAAYAYGAQTVLIPWGVLREMIAEDSPLAPCIVKKKCLRNLLLTGGFIDEARNRQSGGLNPSFSVL